MRQDSPPLINCLLFLILCRSPASLPIFYGCPHCCWSSVLGSYVRAAPLGSLCAYCSEFYPYCCNFYVHILDAKPSFITFIWSTQKSQNIIFLCLPLGTDLSCLTHRAEQRHNLCMNYTRFSNLWVTRPPPLSETLN